MKSKDEDKIATLAKIGYASKGIVYFLVGTLTARYALNLGGEKASNTDAFYFLIDFPGGSFLLGLLAIGLLLYALTRFYQGTNKSENDNNSGKEYLKRASHIFSGLLYTSLAYACAKIVIGSYQKSEDGDSQQYITSKLLQLPYGSWLVGALALIIVGVGLYQIFKGISGSFMKDVSGLAPDKRKFLERVGRAGFISRGVVFGIIGYLFMQAAWFHNSEAAGGKANAFAYLQSWPYGSWVLAAAAIGFMAYGVFMLVQARYADIKIS